MQAMTDGNIILKRPHLLSVVSSAVALVFAAGCYTYTPEELATRLKKEVPVPERLPASVEKRAAAALLGEWEGSQKELNSIYGVWESTEDIHFEFQFFEDNTFCAIMSRKTPYSRHSTTSHGSWRYADGKLEMHTYKDGVMRRELPLRLFWRSDTLVEVRYDSLVQEQEKYNRDTLGKTYKYTSKYDEDGFWLRFIDHEENDTRMMSAHARSPLLLTRVGDAIRPPSGVAMQNPVEVNQTTVSPGAVRAQQESAEAFSRSVVELANGLGGAMSQQQPLNRPVAVNNPVVGSMQSAGGVVSTGQKICPACYGNGRCRPCNGTGKNPTKKYARGHLYDSAIPENCRPCSGTGKCLTCGGKGHL